MTRVSYQLTSVTLDNSVGGAPLTVDILDVANQLINKPIAQFGPGSMLTLLITSTGLADAYIGTSADIASEGTPGELTTTVTYLAGTLHASSPDYDLGRVADLKFRLQDTAVLLITPLLSSR